MWPFDPKPSQTLTFRSVDAGFAAAGQIRPEDMPKIAEAGFKTVLCARPDHEEGGQPEFALIARAAKEAGLQAVHIPVSGLLGEGHIIRMERALAELPTPILGYCRSGARAISLYSTTRRALS